MEEIKYTLYSIAVIAIATGVLEMLAGFGKLQKYTKYIISLVILLSLVYPLQNLTAALETNLLGILPSETTQSTEEYTYLTRVVENAVKENISQKLAVPSGVLTVKTEIVQTAEEYLINYIEITITDKEYFRYAERIEAYVKSNFGCNVSVLQAFKE